MGQTEGNLVDKCSLVYKKKQLKEKLSLSLCFNGHFSCGPGLAGTKMSPLWISLELRVTEVVVTAGAIRNANSNHIITTNKSTPNTLQAGCLSVAEPTMSKH